MEKLDVAESFWDFKGQGDYTDKMFLMSTPFPVAMILILYLWFVLKFGPDLMKNRKPMELGNTLLTYNAIQVLISFLIFARGATILYSNGMWSSTCHCERDDLRTIILDGSHFYFMVKVIELLDTVFFVLRKKQKQVSFLHVYHHTIMVIATWCIVKYNKSDSTIFLGTINSLVHLVMYTYYGLSVYPSLAKYLWWKKYITIMQLVQFTLMFIHIVVSHVVSDCKPAFMLLFSVCTNTVLFMFLFGDFYLKSYSKRKANQINKDESNNSKVEEQECTKGFNYLVNQHKLAAKMN